jgi:protein TonB
LAISDDPSALAAKRPRGLAARWDDLRDDLQARLGDSVQRRKAASLAIALLIEALIILLLFTLGTQIAGDKQASEIVTEFAATDFAPEPEAEPEQPPEPPAESAATPPEPQPVPDEAQPLLPPEPVRPPSPLVSNPTPAPPPPPPAQPQPSAQPSASPTIAARINPGRNYGPADTGPPRGSTDSERVGTAPNGEPLYAARWYREPTRQELAGYLSTATGPASALIACRIVSGYYVEDCELLSESPQGSQMGRAVMAAAWQFRVRPARIGGREQFGTWVRIRIDYSLARVR